MKRLSIFLVAGILRGVLFAADPGITQAEELAKKWKRTKSLAAPVEKVRKGITVETGPADSAVPPVMEVTVDADTEERFQNIQFALDSDRLEGATTFAQLAEIAKAMQMTGTEKFLIEGHTCDLGDDAHNLTLSQRRALAVKRHLNQAGVPAERLQVIGFGESDPATANTSESARQQNRRVQIFRKL
jgi:outer membrane protein OmpA-like peptidoglycan-associated protein